MTTPNRVSKIQYYLNLAKEVASRSTCYRTRQGSLIVRDDQVISTGYVGAPRHTKDCFERGNCLRNLLNVPAGQRYELCRSVHAEQNAIINAARAGVSLLGATMYHYSCRLDADGNASPQGGYPCFICKKMLVNAGIKWYVGAQADGTAITYDVDQWAQDWQEKDLIDDDVKYGEAKKINN